MKRVILLTLAFLLIFSCSVSATIFDLVGISLREPSQKVEVVEKEEEEETKKYISLMYHKISEAPREEIEKTAYCISPEEFEADIKYLKEEGYHFCTVSDIDKIKENKWEKCVFITFDDGYESDYVYALPILEKYDAKATFFVIGSQIGKDDNITKSQLEAMSKSENVEIGSHSYDIHNMSLEEKKEIIERQDITLITDDFLKNKECLEKIINKPIVSLSYPNGIWNQEVDAALRLEGVMATFTSDEALISDLGAPFGRYNRSFDRTPAQLIEKAYNFTSNTPVIDEVLNGNVKDESPVTEKTETDDKNNGEYKEGKTEQVSQKPLYEIPEISKKINSIFDSFFRR